MKINTHHYVERSLSGRYINADHLKELLDKHSTHCDISVIGKSVLSEDIHFINVGSGAKKILMWSQMHGNESTTTKAIFDLLNMLSDNKNKIVQAVLANCTIGIIPMVSPDGARAYTRLNANQVDLNRDAQSLSQPESIALRKCFENFMPDYCFNLHGQRTIFSAGETNKSAIVSFLAPAQDEARSITPTRKIAMEVICKMNDHLQDHIPGHVGIYDDTFNINCVGDSFQALGVPTILFEAGHYPGDYMREKVRTLIFQSLWIGICNIALNEVKGVEEKAYFKIPQNKKLFYDIIVRNAKVKGDGETQNTDIAVQYKEQLVQGNIEFIPILEKICQLESFHGHKDIDAQGGFLSLEQNEMLKEGSEIDFVRINQEKVQFNVETK